MEAISFVIPVIIGIVLGIGFGAVIGICLANRKSHITAKDCQHIMDFHKYALQVCEDGKWREDASDLGRSFERGRANGIIWFFSEIDDMFNVIDGRHKK